MSDARQKDVVVAVGLAYNSRQTRRRFFESSVIVMSIMRPASDNRRRWRAVVGGLLVAVMMACPLLCRAGTCCSGRAEVENAETADEDACPHCQQAEQQRSQVPPLSPRNPLGQGQCLCSGATLPVVVSAPQQQFETSRHPAAEGLRSDRLSGLDVQEAGVDAAKCVSSGRGLCVAHCVLIC